jgi:rod shape-determining protein MreD
VKGLWALGAIALALALQTTLARFGVGGTAAVDLVLVAVVYVALTSGPVAGMVTGSVAGLIQDALSSGIIGVGGLAKLIVGFVVGVIGQQFIMTAPLPRLVMFLGATALHAAVFLGLYVGLNAALNVPMFPVSWKALAGQALGNALVGIVAFAIIERMPGALERRRMSRGVRR